MFPSSWSTLALSALLPALRVAAQGGGGTQAQDLGTILSLCGTPQIYAEVGPANAPVGFGLSNVGQCSNSATPMNGDTECPNSFIEGYCTPSNCYFSCANSLAPLCAGTICPLGTTCMSTADSNGNEHYFCGIECAGGFYLCDAMGAQRLNPNYVPYCSPAQDVCATCAGSQYLTANGGCSQPVITFQGGIAPSGTSTRRRREQLRLEIEEEAKSNPYCPRGLTKCGVQGSRDEYECVDTTSDLESCGGCAGSGGMDCSSLPGVALGAVTCSSGECVASQCEKGYTLVSGDCISDDPNAPRLPKRETSFTRNTKTSLNSRQVSRERLYVREQLGVKPGQTVTAYPNYQNGQ